MNVGICPPTCITWACFLYKNDHLGTLHVECYHLMWFGFLTPIEGVQKKLHFLYVGW